MKPNIENKITLRVWGDFACYSRPEMKVERVSYPIITPSAARGVLEAVFWEPQMYYLIDCIRVVKRGRWISIRRNEVTKVISLDSAQTWMKSPEKLTHIQAGGGADDGTQRNMLALRDVEYLITAEVRVTPLANRGEDKLEKYLAEIERRARSGKCFHRPGLGMREFAADFEWECEPDSALLRRQNEIRAMGASVDCFTEDLGLMLYDVFDHRKRAEGFRWLNSEEMASQEQDFNQSISSFTKGEQTKRRKEFNVNRLRSNREPIKPQLMLFHAKVEDSCMDCHPDRIQIITA